MPCKEIQANFAQAARIGDSSICEFAESLRSNASRAPAPVPKSARRLRHPAIPI